MLPLADIMLPLGLEARAESAGTYFGSVNTRVSAGSFSTESPLGVLPRRGSESRLDYRQWASVTGTVSASGAVTCSPEPLPPSRLTREAFFCSRDTLRVVSRFTAPAPPDLNAPVPAPLTFDAPEIHSAIERIATDIRTRHRSTTDLCLIGITNGGTELNRRLAAILGSTIPTGELDPSFHRDDIGRNPIPKETRPSIIPFDVADRTVILVDDVLFSGRTLKAALSELFDHGRPGAVELAVLVDRGGHKLPFAADYVGLTVDAGTDKKVVVSLNSANPAADRIEISTFRK